MIGRAPTAYGRIYSPLGNITEVTRTNTPEHSSFGSRDSATLTNWGGAAVRSVTALWLRFTYAVGNNAKRTKPVNIQKLVLTNVPTRCLRLWHHVRELVLELLAQGTLGDEDVLTGGGALLFNWMLTVLELDMVTWSSDPALQLRLLLRLVVETIVYNVC